jgi:cytochrome c biogenesis protein CcmG/thiol:disulfide interchange protein DsbE
MPRFERLLPAVLGLFLLSLLATALPADAQELTKEERKWLETLPRADAASVVRSMGWSAPDFPDSARWQGEPGPSIESLRGKVTLIQTFTTMGTGRSAAGRLDRVTKPLADEEDFVTIAVHTPEHLDRIDTLLPRLKLDVPVLVDEQGAWCDAVGAFRRPVSYLVDRQGTIRYAGLSPKGIEAAARKLLAEPYDETVQPRNREEELEAAKSRNDFPTYETPVGSSADRRGQTAPDFYVERMWKDPVTTANDKVVVLDFWATWCGPCVKAIPHMNKLQEHYGNQLVCVGISDESSFKADMVKRGLKMNDFSYGLATDTTGTLKNFFQIRGIPHVVVLSGDWVVRWQGHPSALTEAVLDPIIKANDEMIRNRVMMQAIAPPPARWVEWLIERK